MRYLMPDPEEVALTRLAAKLGGTSAEVARRAVVAWFEAGRPAIRTGPPGCSLDAQSAMIWRAVRWWLRQAPATELQAPDLLAEEARAAAAAGDMVRELEAYNQLARIGGDVEHPQRKLASELLFSFIPEPKRSEIRAKEQTALQLVTAAATRRARA